MIDGRPGDERAFLHKSKIGKFFGQAVERVAFGAGGKKGVISVGKKLGGPFAQAAGFAEKFGQPSPIQVIPSTFTPQPSATTFPGQPFGFHGGGNGNGAPGPCPPPLRRNTQGLCVATTSPFGAQEFGGEVIAGQYGAGYIAGSRIVDVAQCPRGTVLGKDNICYANLANKNRLYPRGRRPLLTGGDMRAISRARTAGNKLANAKSDLLAIGMLKAAGPRKRRKKTVPTC